MEPKAGTSNRTLQEIKTQFLNRTSSYNFTRPRSYVSIFEVSGWATLPQKILEAIFQYLDKHYLLRYVTLVCKDWRRAAMKPIFIQAISISRDEAPLWFVYNFLREYNSLSSLNLDNVKEPLAILMQANKVCHGLKKISLTNYPKLDAKIINYITKYFSKLEGLNLEGSKVLINYVSKELTLLKNLKMINIFNIKSPHLSINSILEIVLNCTKLEEIHIGLLPPSINLKDDDVVLILTNTAEKLRALTLDARLLTMKSLQLLEKCPNLRTLFIKFAVNLTGDFLVELGKNLCSIHTLGFTHNCNINGHDVHLMLRYSEEVFTDLVYLDLTYCVLLNDEGISAIANTCRKLQKVHLKSCRSVTNIIPLCVNCKDLKFLDVSYCLQLKINFNLPRQIGVLIIDERKKWTCVIEKYKKWKYLKIYISLFEYNNDLELVSRELN